MFSARRDVLAVVRGKHWWWRTASEGGTYIGKPKNPTRNCGLWGTRLAKI